jgi:ceramide glucosyltransferase
MAWAAALLLGMPVLGWCALLGSVLGRSIQAWVVARYVVREKRIWLAIVLFPLRDLIGFVIWMLSYTSNRIQWRGEVYELVDGGRMRPLWRKQPDMKAKPVSVRPSSTAASLRRISNS